MARYWASILKIVLESRAATHSFVQPPAQLVLGSPGWAVSGWPPSWWELNCWVAINEGVGGGDYRARITQQLESVCFWSWDLSLCGLQAPGKQSYGDCFDFLHCWLLWVPGVVGWSFIVAFCQGWERGGRERVYGRKSCAFLNQQNYCRHCAKFNTKV